jgi:hypothetical protein
MAASTRANVGENAPKADVSDSESLSHRVTANHEQLANHHERISAIEKHLGIKTEKGVKGEETAGKATRKATVTRDKVEKMRERARH